MTVLRRALPFLVLSLLLFVAGCALLPAGDGGGSSLARELAAAEARWAAKGLDSYRFTLAYHCFCPFQDPFDVTVEDGRVTSVTVNGAPVGGQDVSWLPLRIESAFRRIEDNLDADQIEATFDPDFGYPARVSANPERDMFDEEFSFEIGNFSATP